MVVGLILGFLFLYSDIVYWTKYLICVTLLWFKKRSQHRRFDLYDFETENEPEKLGVLVPKEEIILESPLSEENLQNNFDEIFMYGVNSKSEAIVVRITRGCNQESEAWIHLNLADGRRFELENNRGYQRNFDENCTSFTCGGLTMNPLSAMRKWRISYNGMMREKKNKEDTERDPVFVKFTFIWTASSDVHDASCDFDVSAASKAIAQTKWNSISPPLEKVSDTLNFYSQSGVLDGIISIENEPEIEMYLFGERTRYLCDGSNLEGFKNKVVLGVIPETGLVLHLEKTSIPNMFQNLYSGFIVDPSSKVDVIKEGFMKINMSAGNENIENLSVNLKADELIEFQGKFVGKTIQFTSDHIWERKFEMTGVSFEINDFKGKGFLISCDIFKKSNKRDESKVPRKKFLGSSNRPLVVYFSDEESCFTELSGGKGSSLGKLTKLSRDCKSEEFAVPNGIIVTTEAYNQFLTSRINEKIEILKNIAYGNVEGNVQEACKMVQAEIQSSHFQNNIVKEIESKINRLFNERITQLTFAVRSSATGEDTDQMSAAGQMETFLGVKGFQKICAAIKKCWASQFSHLAVEYKRQNGQILNSPMAVVVQEMVDCDSSGVMFTCDPVTNNPSVTVITGNYGLGESVVSGTEEPDTIVLQKLSDGSFKIKDITVGLKKHRIVVTDQELNEEMGTVVEDVPESQRNQCCISEDLAITLGKLSSKIEKYFKSPRDIEWGMKNNNIFILQSRPVTTGELASDYEIMHELDGPMRCEDEFFTTCNVGEVIPGACSPLGINFANKILCAACQKKSRKEMTRSNFQQSKYFDCGIVPFYLHQTMAVIELLSAQSDDLSSLTTQGMMVSVFGRILDDPELKVRVKQRKYPLKKTKLMFLLTFIKDLFFAGCGLEEFKKEIFNYESPAESGKTSEEIFNLIMKYCSHPSKTYDVHFNNSMVSSTWNICLFSVLSSAKGCIDNDVYSDFAKLLASSSNVESADVPAGMKHLAHCIDKDIGSKKFKSMSVEEAQTWLETTTTLSGVKYREFIRRHGHRCLKEIDIYSIAWYEDSKSLIKLLQNLSGTGEEVKTKKEIAFSDILPHLTIPLSFKSRMLMKFILPNCRKGIRNRENCKSIFIKAFDNMRKGFRKLGSALVAEGYLPEKELMYFLTLEEIRDLLKSRNPRLISRAKHRRKLFPYMDSILLPDISKGRPIPVNENQNESHEFKADLTMTGIPVSQGSVRGYARVATNLSEAADLKPGEILITRATDVGWSPYFPIIAGLVTELGGLISHGAVISREYGLPCVVGLHGATRLFVTGDYVLLDGNKGILQRLSHEENEKTT